MPIRSVETFDSHLRVHFAEESFSHADFHYRWLRHNSELDRHPTTRERTLCSSELPDQVWPIAVRVDEGKALLIDWSDTPERESSRYESGWLREYAYAADRESAPPPPSEISRLLHPSSEPDGAGWIDYVDTHGALVVRGFGDDTEKAIETIAARGLRVIETHFGRIEDLRTDNTTNKNTDQLGYTDASVNLHTDQPFLQRPPRYQLLHCMRPAGQGGDNAVVDAEAAAKYLRDIDEEAYRLLSTVPVSFDRRQKNFRSLVVAPIFGEAEGRFQIRYSYFTMAPYNTDFAKMEAWYRAFDRFARLVRDEKHQFRIRLDAGDFILYDNWRMLHARTSFRGARWMRGVYFDR